MFLIKLAKNQMKSKINSHASEVGTISGGMGGVVLVVYITAELEEARRPAVPIRIMLFYCHYNGIKMVKQKERFHNTYFLLVMVPHFLNCKRTISRLEFRNWCFGQINIKQLTDTCEILKK